MEIEGEEKEDYVGQNPKDLQDFINNPTFSDRITTPVAVTAGEVFLMVLKFSINNSLSVTGMTNLFKLINTIFQQSILPDSRYICDKLLNSKIGVEFHAVCHNCTAYLGEFSTLPRSKVCNICQEDIDLSCPSNSSFFVLIDPSKQIADLLNIYGEYYKFVTRDRRHEENYISDVYDGKGYRDFQRLLQDEDRYNYVSAVFNTDGAPKFKCSGYSIWPLYLMLNELPPQIRAQKLITCGLWFHKKKPDMRNFLSPFVDLINKVSKSGIECTIQEEKRLIKVHILTCCVDSVARAPVQGIKQFNGEFGCNWCLHPGKYRDGSMRYPAIKTVARTHEETVKLMVETDLEHPVKGVKYPSPLILLTFFNIITGFVVDYLHCCLEGVAKQFTNYYLSPLNDAEIKKLDDELKTIAAPQQVSRLSRGLSCRNDWKAREWENFILYYSIPLFCRFLSRNQFEHWILFAESLHILLKDRIHISELNIANEKLHKFVAHTENLFGIKAMTFNVHLLTHICESVLNWGPLWANSTFSFESANRLLLQSVKCSKGVPQQIVRYVMMNNSISIIEERVKRYASHNIMEYCYNILSKRVKNIRRTSEVIYFGKGDYVDEATLNHLQLQRTTTRKYIKMVKNNCLYESCLIRKNRSNNSFAMLSDGRFIRIVHFIVNAQNHEEVTVCNLIRTRKCFISFYKELQVIEDIDCNEMFLSTSDINRVCIRMDISGTSYLCPLPNLLHY